MSHIFCLIIEADSFPTVIPGPSLSRPLRKNWEFSSPPYVNIVPPSPISSPVIPSVTIPMPQPPSRGNVSWGPLPPGFVPQTITDPSGVSTPIWQPGTLPPISIEPLSPYSPYSSLTEGSYSPYQRSYKPWPSPATLPRYSALSSSQDTFSAEADALRERQRQLYDLLELELLNPDDSVSSTSSHVYDGSTCFAGPTADDPHAGDARSTGPSSPHLLRPNASYLYGGTPDLSFVEFDLDDTGVLEPDQVLNVSRQRDNSSTKHNDEENLSFSLQSRDQRRLESAEDSMNMLGLWGIPLMSQPSLDEG